MLFKRKKTDWLVVLVIAAGLFGYTSYQPRFKLPSNMPSEFALESKTKGD